MDRWLATVLVAGILAAISIGSAAGSAVAADKSLPDYERRLLERHKEAAHKALAEKLRLERAQRIARARHALPPAPKTQAIPWIAVGGQPVYWQGFGGPPFCLAARPPRPFHW